MAKPLKETLTDIANAIREKDGTTTTMTSQEMPARIRAIPSGGGESDGLPLLIIDQHDGDRDECGRFVLSSATLDGVGKLIKISSGYQDSYFSKKLNTTDVVPANASFTFEWGSWGCGGQLNYHVIAYFYGKNAPETINLNTDWSGEVKPLLPSNVITAINTAIKNKNVILFDIYTNG